MSSSRGDTECGSYEQQDHCSATSRAILHKHWQHVSARASGQANTVCNLWLCMWLCMLSSVPHLGRDSRSRPRPLCRPLSAFSDYSHSAPWPISSLSERAFFTLEKSVRSTRDVFLCPMRTHMQKVRCPNLFPHSCCGSRCVVSANIIRVAAVTVVKVEAVMCRVHMSR